MFVVLGMCHSGTTCLASTIARAGVDFGVVRKSWEHDAILRLHVQMARWDDPVVAVPTGEHRTERDRILREYGLRGMKDPLTLFTIDLWRELPDVRLVGTFRHPRGVTPRLVGDRRLRYSDAEAERLWVRYNRRLLDIHNESPFPLVSFDSESYVDDVRSVLVSIGIDSTSTTFDPARRTTRTGARAFLEKTEDLHRELLERAVRGRGTSLAPA